MKKMYEFMDKVPRKYHKVDFNQKGYGGKPEEVPREQANVISSIGTDGLHYPVLDLDIPAFLVPSSTPGHSHLYLNIGIDPDTYFELLQALSRAGILEEGYETFWVCVFLWPLLLLLGAGSLLKELVEHLAKKAGGLKMGPQDSFRADSGNREV